jgi:hypothetical protein
MPVDFRKQVTELGFNTDLLSLIRNGVPESVDWNLPDLAIESSAQPRQQRVFLPR